MDQDSRSSEPRERAVSSEPCSTRPNPFDDGDLSARKRRRTSLSGSRSASVDTLPSRDDAVASDPSIMKVDTPEPIPPSTPAHSEPATEPVSSKVTINLRNADSLEDTPSSPSSPTPARSRKDSIKVSVEEPEVNMIEVPSVEDGSSSASEMDSPEVPTVSFEEDFEFCNTQPNITLLPEARAASFSAAMVEFPYHSEGESYQETVSRLAEYFRQQPTHVDEALQLLNGWLNRYTAFAHIEFYPIVVEAYQENKQFWQTLPELFYTIVHRHGYSKSTQTRETISQMFTQLAKLTAFLLTVDCRTLVYVINKEDADFDLISPGFIKLFGSLTSKDDSQLANTYALANSGFSELLDILQANSDGLQLQLSRFTDLLLNNLLRSPRRVMDNLTGVSMLMDSLVRDSYRKQSYSGTYSAVALERARKNLAYGLDFFRIIADALDVVIEKSTNNLSSETVVSLTACLSPIFRYSLLGSNAEANKLMQDHRQQHPNLPDRFTPEAMNLEWRIRIFCKLVRSRQMQLRVTAATQLCDDLVLQWRTYADRQEIGDENPYLTYLRYLSSYLVETGIVDYLLGPTCHPEITQASFNIVGFLAVTKTYISAQTDLLWQTLTSTQDPRISDAIVRMMSKVVGLLDSESLCYICEKFHGLPVEAFSSCMRDFFENVTKQLQEKMLYHLPITPYKTCIRLLQESSVYGSQGSVAYPEIHQFALTKFGALLHPGPDHQERQTMRLDCVHDIAAKTRTTSGSLEVLNMLMDNPPSLQAMIAEHDLTRLLVDELESTIANAQAVGFAPVYTNPISHARRRILSTIIISHGSTIDSELGRRLWDLLVGNGAACQEDRKTAWDDLNMALRRARLDNPFLGACLREYLPELPPSCYCGGSLAFVREAIIPLANDINGMVLDDDDSVRLAGLELLWQMILTAPNHTIEETAISTLVNDIYVDSQSIMSYPLHRARKVHFALVQRCLQQLKRAAQKLKEFGDGDLAIDVAINEQRQEQELQFTRSLQVLIALLKALQARPHFAAPDLRSLMLQAPSPVDGDSAELKYQSFDGEEQTDVKSLDIGLKNTAASLLASLREATGFDNYRLYYRGQPLAPSESAICKPIEELDIRNGLILVKKESGIATSKRIKPGASPLDIEILSHFKDLWEYLSMEEKLAREIYHFLVSLPADDSILTTFEDPTTSYRDVFPLGQPFKSLYALHALREYLSTRQLKSNVMQVSSPDGESQVNTANDRQDALVRAISLIVAAICDPEVVERGSSEGLQLKLSLELVDNFVQLLKETPNVETGMQQLNLDLQKRLSAILTNAALAQTNQVSIELINRSFEALLEPCIKGNAFWEGFRDETGVQKVVQRLLLDDSRPIVRKNVARLITYKSINAYGISGGRSLQFAELFWPIVSQLVPRAVREPSKCEETFCLCFQLLHKLNAENPSAINLPACLRQCAELLLSYTTTEDIAHPDKDVVAHGLITILNIGITEASIEKELVEFPTNFVSKLFSRHLFPPEDEDDALVPKVILHTPSRSMLYDIIFALVKDDVAQTTRLLYDLNQLTSHRIEDGLEIYKYELPQAFERSTAIRSSCGYSGLRNLSNTCYLNSLFTQLFMNVGFRRFMLEKRVRNPLTHPLLHETQVLFAFLQDSRRRWVEPSGCVGQITTYDETPIDIHNQMDVDEFYSLLFDRWEAQFSLESDKKSLRSIYGGELVQQVKSKECEHISERIEPFSAIQCDIKGKAGLEESLQAYVDGEIMEGDNKYKCSECDRHVDAVKRACLKDIPDNLIFHLKRFDFNLRTLTRSKINDYFPFPTKVDMQPYTIEHLSDPSRNSEPDMFELVGVLVHSGTAESGHYYSYIRERPTASSTPSWVEFNDEVVTSWDPAQMESACFGGPEYRPQFEAGTTYEKVYSAYMLFYQRSSSLQKEQEMLRASGHTGPLRADLPKTLESQVSDDNWSIIQRHCLYDPAHMPFVYELLLNSWGTKCSKDHRKENLAMQTALGHMDQIASRAKDLPDFDQLKGLLIKVCQRCPLCCFAFFNYFKHHKDALRMLLQRNTDVAVRQDVGRILIFAICVIKNSFPDEYGPFDSDGDVLITTARHHSNVMEITIDLFYHIWDAFHLRINSWTECFGTMLEFARLGRYEAVLFLDRDFLSKLLMVIAADQALDLPNQYARLLNAVSRRSARPPNYESIIALIEELLSNIEPTLSQNNILEEAHGRLLLALQGEPVPLTAAEVNILHRDWARGQANVFVEKLISLNQNPMATDCIISRLIGFNPVMDQKVYATLRLDITGDLTSHMVSPYLRVATTYCRDSSNGENVFRLVNFVASQCKNLQNAEGRAFFEFHRDVFDGPRNTGETMEMIHLHGLDNIPKWAPGLLGYIDQGVSDEVDNFLQEKLFKHGPSPAFGESNGGLEKSRAMNSAARLLAISCLEYLRDTYVVRAAQAARYTVVPLDRIIKKCEPYFHLDEEMDDGLEVQFNELCRVVLEPMDRLTVDEIEEDGSDWEQSVGSSEPMDNLADISMQIDRDLV
ncbi:uncharacterized protein GGS22DRAFT_106755 [Annulohypoxylon maeteangense]|uniref:uncharacterized protein n=1 Tax=Annulohypoxylon maeteangense TaxID=1927788 RepID=UPI00200879EB|nr:uncharacterized protein GGS22DRAFT_106755 [Annulohypoxylon maeteangense]KAI0887252.1 hypothetical protein GGS22DRAFT_106755 [Annulohypoxylon maeteangense]